MTTETKIALGFMAALTIPTLAHAASAIDTNGDGAYSLPEMLVLLPELTEVDFMEFDSNGDGLLSVEEYDVGVEAGVFPAIES